VEQSHSFLLPGLSAHDATTIPNKITGVKIFITGSPTAACEAAAPDKSKNIPA